jgi:hypothetical protein
MTLTTTEWVSAGPVYLVSAGDFQAEIAKLSSTPAGSEG